MEEKNIPQQIFNGKVYHKYQGERYYSRGNKRLHREVWKHYHGEIPKGYHVHHKDGNPENNTIENLELVQENEHLHKHAQEHLQSQDYIEKARMNVAKAQDAAKEWHKSEDGKEWHSKHAREQFRKRQYIKRTCQCCGKEYETRTISKSRFCSNNCKAKWRRDNHLDDEVRICELCGKEFVVNKYSPIRFCSKSCATRYNRSK